MTEPAAVSPPAPAPAPAPAAPAKPITLKQEWLLIGICGAVIAGLEITGALVKEEGALFFTGLSRLTSWFGHAVWLSMDRRRRGLETGAWRFGVVFFGPLAIVLYLVLEYRARALYLIPLMLAVYLGIGGVIVVGLLLAGQSPFTP